MAEVAEDSAPTAFFTKTFDEAYDLLIDVRGYIELDEAADRAARPPLEALELSRETMRLTTRLTHIMAWLLVQKAVFADEIQRAAAARAPYRLGGQSVCLDESWEGIPHCPPRLAKLLDRTRRLYVRVDRLDAMAAKGLGKGPGIFDLW